MDCFTELVQCWYVLPLEPDMIYLIHMDNTKATCIAVASSPGYLPFSAHPCFPLVHPVLKCFFSTPPPLSLSCSLLSHTVMGLSFKALLGPICWYFFKYILSGSEGLPFAVILALLLLSVLLRRWPCLPIGFKAFHYFLFKFVFKANFYDKYWPNNDNIKDSGNNTLSY